ncbi:hypothetical protein QNA23_10635 [Rhodococcus erythropolis]|uniref:hypothetical protein n=1 Tax=Rhodococcus erythropolis TaxID=1833 RepID=UPI0024B8F044|nr:hypothetical protein [Rhodococcus erythropolis]MDJ0403938.1 hypothetical protein [Rhodococcus erythropolis]
MSTPAAVAIAAAVLAKAALIDYRMPKPDDAVIEVWAEVFAGQQVWLAEAIDAVAVHYRQPEAPRLMPGHILKIVASLPLGANSSDDRINHWLGQCSRNPYSLAVEDRTGIAPPQWEPPTGLTIAESTDWASQQYRAWLLDNRDRLAHAVRTHTPRTGITSDRL